MAEIPIIDIRNISGDDFDNKLVSACYKALTKTGFFYLRQDIISNTLMKELLEISNKYFNLPEDIKKNHFDSKLNRGYTGLKEETLDPENQILGDTKEGYYIGVDVTDENKINPEKFKGPNVYPTDKELPEFKTKVDEYINKALILCRRLVVLIALTLKLPPHSLDENFTDPLAVLRLIRYSHEPSNVEEGVLGCGSHSDYGFITLLLTSMDPGLQVWSIEKEEWLDIEPLQNTFVVNIGDMLQRWSNGLYRSTLHRVVISSSSSSSEYSSSESSISTNASSSARLSAPFFFEPNYDTIIQSLVKTNDGDSNKYPPIKSGEYLKAKYRQTHADFEG